MAYEIHTIRAAATGPRALPCGGPWGLRLTKGMGRHASPMTEWGRECGETRELAPALCAVDHGRPIAAASAGGQGRRELVRGAAKRLPLRPSTLPHPRRLDRPPYLLLATACEMCASKLSYAAYPPDTAIKPILDVLSRAHRQ